MEGIFIIEIFTSSLKALCFSGSVTFKLCCRVLDSGYFFIVLTGLLVYAEMNRVLINRCSC